jgi:hypothetical protein
MSLADKARAELLEVITAGKLDAKTVGKRFHDEYGQNINTASHTPIQAFTQVIRDEIALDEAAAK